MMKTANSINAYMIAEDVNNYLDYKLFIAINDYTAITHTGLAVGLSKEKDSMSYIVKLWRIDEDDKSVYTLDSLSNYDYYDVLEFVISYAHDDFVKTFI